MKATDLLIEQIEAVAHSVVHEGTNRLGHLLDGPPGDLSSPLRAAGFTAEQFNGLPNDEELLDELARHPKLQAVMRKLLREALVSISDDADTYEAENGGGE